MRPRGVVVYSETSGAGGPGALEKVARAARSAGLEVMCVEGSPVPDGAEATCGHPVDCVGLVLGGDGTILRGLDHFMDGGMPSLGINTGHLGYLASAEIDGIDEVMRRIAGGAYTVEMLPVVTAVMPGGGILHAINDICINRSLAGGMLHLTVRSGEEPIARIAGDGAVLSTPVGSTAYALSAGGPIIDPGLPALLLVPLCAHQISLRPIVFAPGTRLSLEAGWVRGDSPVVSTDGRPSGTLAQGDVLEVMLSEGHCPLIRLGMEDGFYARLGRKFGWGARG